MVHGEVEIVALDSLHALVLMDGELVVVGYAAIVFQRFGAAGLFADAGHGDVADLQQLRRGEEHHVGGVMVKRIHHTALVEDQRLEPAALQFDSAGQTRGPAPTTMASAIGISEHSLHGSVDVSPARQGALRDFSRRPRPCRDVRRPSRPRPAPPDRPVFRRALFRQDLW